MSIKYKNPIIAVASGKGGTGKTTFAVNLAYSISENVQYLDADVEAPNGHIFLKPTITSKNDSMVPIPVINKDKCTSCGKCQEACQFNALVVLENNYLFFPELCHGCGTCKLVCPQDAITEEKRAIGKIDIGFSKNIQCVTGILNEGEVKAPPLIEQVKDKINPDLTNIIDCSPGSSCPAIEGIKNSDYVVMVTEPTPFGLHDLRIAVEMVRILGISFGVVINKSGLGNNEVYKFCENENIPILMEIPFKKEYAKECSKGNIIANVFPEIKDNFLKAYEKLTNQLAGGDIS